MPRFLTCGAYFLRGNKMKKHIFAGAFIVLLLIGSNLWADPPVCPPFEGFYIETITNVKVYGDLAESEDFEWKWNNDYCQETTNGIADNDLQANESVGRITYSEEFDSYNGHSGTGGGDDSKNYSRGDPIPEEPTEPTTLTKTFVADSHVLNSDNNVTVEKHIGYQSDGGAGSQADFKEIVSVEVVSAGGALTSATGLFKGVLALCPWATTSSTDWPATNEGIAMGSKFHIPSQLDNDAPGEITFASNTAAGVTKGASMVYDVTANGKGTIETEMIARLWEGSIQGTNATIALNSVATYSELAHANGIFEFHKSMTYRAEFAAPSVADVNTTILE